MINPISLIIFLVSCFLGLGLGLQEGSDWASRRKLLTPAFHFNILKPYVEVFQESSFVLLVRSGLIE